MSSVHHVNGLGDQRSGHNPRRSQLHTGIMLTILHKQQRDGELIDIRNVWQVPSIVEPVETEVTMMSRNHYMLNSKIGDRNLTQVQQSFKYLGSTINEQNTQEEEVKNRIA